MPLSVLVKHDALIIRSSGASLQVLSKHKPSLFDVVGLRPTDPGTAA